MTIKAPSSAQEESLEYVFKTRNTHVQNIVDWLIAAREASVKSILQSTPDMTERAIGMANALDDIIATITKHTK